MLLVVLTGTAEQTNKKKAERYFESRFSSLMPEWRADYYPQITLRVVRARRKTAYPQIELSYRRCDAL